VPADERNFLRELPKAELHLHLEGTIHSATVCALTARHGVRTTEEEVHRRYNYTDFVGFLDAFKWVTSFLREPADYALITHDLCEQLLEQNVVYAEVTLSVGVMLLRNQRPEANFAAILRAAEEFASRGLSLRWIFDAVRQFGAEAALRVVRAAKNCVYEAASAAGLHRLMHAGEVGGPEKVREAVELLHIERVGHGIAAVHDPALLDLLADRRIPLEVCPVSNLRTGALARQLRRSDVALEDHPLPQLLRHGVPIVLSTDDPAMFHTDLVGEYIAARQMGLSEGELRSLAQASFAHAFDLRSVPSF